MASRVSALNLCNSQLHRWWAVATILAAAVLVGTGLTGCGASGDPSNKVPPTPTGSQYPASKIPPPPTESHESEPASPAVMEPILTAWQQGDKALAIRQFTEADWKARPLFAPGSLLSLSETQFAAIPASDRQAKANDMLKEIGVFLQLVKAVARAGEEAAEEKDSAQSRKYFASLKQCAEALDEGDSLSVVKQATPMMKKRADEGLAKLGP